MAEITKMHQRPSERLRVAQMEPFEAIEHLFDDYLPRAWFRHRECRPSRRPRRPLEPLAPAILVIEGDEEICVRAEVAGVSKEDLDVSLSEQSLTIQGRFPRGQAHADERPEDRPGDPPERACAEADGGHAESFFRTLRLPVAVDVRKANAHLRDGVLEVSIPRLAESRQRRIEIQ